LGALDGVIYKIILSGGVEMEAWILHIREDSKNGAEDPPYTIANYYSAWSTEKQAFRAAGEYIQKINSFTQKMSNTLLKAAQTLVNLDQVELAVDLLNEQCSRIEFLPGFHPPTLSRKFIFTIRQSTFLGNVFE
jgi:hypothetical protein